MRFSLLVLCLASAITLVPSVSQAAGPSPGLVWVDANGNIVGPPVYNYRIAIQASSGLVIAASVVPEEVYDTLYGELTLNFRSVDCSGTAYVEKAGERYPINAGDVQLVLSSTGDLYSYDVSEAAAPSPTIRSKLKANSDGGSGCFSASGMHIGWEATLVEADFLSQFTLPLHLEHSLQPLAFLPTGPWWLTVALLGTGVALQWRYFRKKDTL